MYVVVGDVDNGRWNGVFDIVEYILCCDFEYYKELWIIVDVEKYVFCFISGLFGNKESKDFVFEKYKK